MLWLIALTWIQIPTSDSPVGILEDNGTFYVVMTQEAAKEYAMAYDKAEAYKSIIEIQNHMLASMKDMTASITQEKTRLYIIAAVDAISIVLSFAFGIYMATKVE